MSFGGQVGEAVLTYGVNALDGLKDMADASVQCVVTSPPYWGLRDYGVDPQTWPSVTYAPMADLPSITVSEQTVSLGLENDPQGYIAHLLLIFREVRRVLRDDGVVFVNLGDSYVSTTGYLQPLKNKGLSYKRINNGGGDNAMDSIRPYKIRSSLEHKNVAGIPWRFALAMQADGWILRNDIVWDKGHGMSESAKDRFSRNHEYVFMFVKQRFYKFNKPTTKTVWGIPLGSYGGEHYATFPERVAQEAIRAGSDVGDTILDPFSGSGTTGKVALDLQRNFRGIDLSEEYLHLAQERMMVASPEMPMPQEARDVFDFFGER